jgi:nickel-dependent lactate racemase
MANKPHKIILPQIVKTDKTRTSKTKVATPLLVPSIIRNNVEEHEIPKVNARRSERIKKPPDKLQY